jgi:hypothetical protein
MAKAYPDELEADERGDEDQRKVAGQDRDTHDVPRIPVVGQDVGAAAGSVDDVLLIDRVPVGEQLEAEDSPDRVDKLSCKVCGDVRNRVLEELQKASAASSWHGDDDAYSSDREHKQPELEKSEGGIFPLGVTKARKNR